MAIPFGLDGSPEPEPEAPELPDRAPPRLNPPFPWEIDSDFDLTLFGVGANPVGAAPAEGGN